MCALQHIEKLIADEKFDEALAILDREISKDATNADALLLRGKIYWRLGQRGRATSDYAAADAIAPNGQAAAALQQAREIEDFFNPDLLNP